LFMQSSVNLNASNNISLYSFEDFPAYRTNGFEIFCFCNLPPFWFSNKHINERDVIIWDVLIAIILQNILRKFLRWQSLIRHECQFKLQNVQRIIYQDLSSNKFATIFWEFHVFQRAYMKDYFSYSCFVTEFG
jgi:hypothetical protein